MSSTLYEKRGRRYFPVKEYQNWDHYPEGFWLVHVKPGGKSITRLVEPDDASFEATKRLRSDVLVDLLVKASEGMPDKTPVTPEQAAAWAACREAFGGMFYVIYPSAVDIVSKFLNLAAEETKRESNT